MPQVLLFMWGLSMLANTIVHCGPAFVHTGLLLVGDEAEREEGAGRAWSPLTSNSTSVWGNRPNRFRTSCGMVAWPLLVICIGITPVSVMWTDWEGKMTQPHRWPEPHFAQRDGGDCLPAQDLCRDRCEPGAHFGSLGAAE